MKKITLAAVVLATLLSTGCAVQKDWSATGGSKSDGTIKLSYQVGMFEAAEVSEEQGINLATKRCSAWGYTNAEAFGGSTQVCTSPSSSGCNIWLVTKEYQCTGGE